MATALFLTCSRKHCEVSLHVTHHGPPITDEGLLTGKDSTGPSDCTVSSNVDILRKTQDLSGEHLWWFECGMLPRGSCVWTLGPQVMVAFWKAVEPGLAGRSGSLGVGLVGLLSDPASCPLSASWLQRQWD